MGLHNIRKSQEITTIWINIYGKILRILILRISLKVNWLCQQNNNVLWGFKYI